MYIRLLFKQSWILKQCLCSQYSGAPLGTLCTFLICIQRRLINALALDEQDDSDPEDELVHELEEASAGGDVVSPASSDKGVAQPTTASIAAETVCTLQQRRTTSLEHSPSRSWPAASAYAGPDSLASSTASLAPPLLGRSRRLLHDEALSSSLHAFHRPLAAQRRAVTGEAGEVARAGSYAAQPRASTTPTVVALPEDSRVDDRPVRLADKLGDIFGLAEREEVVGGKSRLTSESTSDVGD